MSAVMTGAASASRANAAWKASVMARMRSTGGVEPAPQLGGQQRAGMLRLSDLLVEGGMVLGGKGNARLAGRLSGVAAGDAVADIGCGPGTAAPTRDALVRVKHAFVRDDGLDLT